jgi:hypothetical protein
MTDEQISPAQEYITKDAISYSALSRLADGPQAFINREKPTGDFLSTGSAVDILLTEGEESFHKQFYVMTENKPTEKMGIYVDTMIATDDHAQAWAASGYSRNPNVPVKSRPDDPTKWEVEGKPYYDTIKAAGDKTILDFEQNAQITSVVNQLKENEYTKQYFTDGAVTQYDEIMYQFIHYFDFLGKPCKVKLDILTIDHTNKRIKGIDLKTTGKSVYSFRTSYRQYRYYLQGALFQEGIIDWAKQHYPDYTIDEFEFIVAEMFTKNQPLIYRMGDRETKYAIYGGETSSGYHIKGITELFADLDYYTSTGCWDYPAEIHDNNGVVELDLFK